MFIAVVMLVTLTRSLAPSAPDLAAAGCAQVIAETGRLATEDKEESESELAFLKRAEAAFLHSHRSTAEVKQRISAVEEELAHIDQESTEPAPERPSVESRIEDLQAGRRFLKRAEAAFLHSHRSTAEVKQRIREVDERLRELRSVHDGTVKLTRNRRETSDP